jgi:hypothetical protein
MQTQSLIIGLFVIKEYFNSLFIILGENMDWVIQNRSFITFGFYGCLLRIYYSIQSILKKVSSQRNIIYFWLINALWVILYFGTIIPLVFFDNILIYISIVFFIYQTYYSIYTSIVSIIKPLPDYK